LADLSHSETKTRRKRTPETQVPTALPLPFVQLVHLLARQAAREQVASCANKEKNDEAGEE